MDSNIRNPAEDGADIEERLYRLVHVDKRDEVMTNMEECFQLFNIADDATFVKDAAWARPGFAHNLGYCRQEFPQMLEWFRRTILQAPRRNDLLPMAKQCFKFVTVSHILVRRIKSPSGDNTTPWVYAALTVEGNIHWRTFAGKVKMGHVQVFLNRHEGNIKGTAEQRQNDIQVSRIGHPSPPSDEANRSRVPGRPCSRTSTQERGSAYSPSAYDPTKLP